MILHFALLIFGFALLIYGADFLVNGASSLAKRFDVSELAIGLTVVAFGTSMPELIVSIISSLDGYNEVTFGNVIGSNNFNTYLILGLTGVIYPISVQRNTIYREIPFSLLVGILLYVLVNDERLFGYGFNVLSTWDGLILAVLFVGFIVYVFFSMKEEANLEENAITVYGIPRTLLMIAGGLLGLVAGGKFVVDNAVAIAQGFGLSERLIGLTILATGTSLPEVATSIVAATKKRSDMAIGNVIGSNIFNILLILSTCALIRPIPYSLVLNTDLYMFFFGTFLVLVATTISGKKRRIDRWEAAVLLATYLSYLVYMILRE
jgi:cation:H+ antiporter